MPVFDITAPDGTHYEVTGPDGATEEQALQQVQAQHGRPAGNPNGPQPTTMQTLGASPVGRFAHDFVLPMIETPARLLSKIDPTGGMVAPMAAKAEGTYQDALAAQRNRPGYAEARQQADKIQSGLPNGLADQFISSLTPTLAGLAGLPGGVNASNAAADSQTAARDAYAQQNPKSSFLANVGGGFLAAPQGGPKALPVLPPKQVAPTIGALNTAKKAAYDIVDNSPMKIAGPEIGQLHADLQTQLGRMGLTEKTMPALAPKVGTALESLKDASTADQTLQAMDIQRRIAGIAAGSTDKTERAAARIVQDGIDGLLSNLQPHQLSGPIDQAAIAALPEARDLASRSFKAEQLQAIIDKAKNNSTGFAQSGYENALRVGFRKLLNNDRGIARFSPAEREAIKQIATGGSAVSATNLLRQVGKLSPQGAIPILSELAMYGVAGPSALAIPAAGIAGRTGATLLQSAAAKKAVNLAALGRGATAIPPAPALQLPRLTPRSALPLGLFGSMAQQPSQ